MTKLALLAACAAATLLVVNAPAFADPTGTLTRSGTNKLTYKMSNPDTYSYREYDIAIDVTTIVVAPGKITGITCAPGFNPQVSLDQCDGQGLGDGGNGLWSPGQTITGTITTNACVRPAATVRAHAEYSFARPGEPTLNFTLTGPSGACPAPAHTHKGHHKAAAKGVSPVAGATYKGKLTTASAAQGSPVQFKVSSNGRKVTSVSFFPPLDTTTCPGQGNAVIVHTPPAAIHNGTFTATLAGHPLHNGAGFTSSEVITGRFLSGRRAVGTITHTGTEGMGPGHTPQTCGGSSAWSAHA